MRAAPKYEWTPAGESGRGWMPLPPDERNRIAADLKDPAQIWGLRVGERVILRAPSGMRFWVRRVSLRAVAQ